MWCKMQRRVGLCICIGSDAVCAEDDCLGMVLYAEQWCREAVLPTFHRDNVYFVLVVDTCGGRHERAAGIRYTI